MENLPPSKPTQEHFAFPGVPEPAPSPKTDSPRPKGGGKSVGEKLADEIKRIQSLKPNDRLKACRRAIETGLPEHVEGATNTLRIALSLAVVETEKLHLTLVDDKGKPRYETATAYYQAILKEQKISHSAPQVSSLLAIGRIGLQIVAKGLTLPTGAEVIRKLKEVDDPLGAYEKLHHTHQGPPPLWSAKEHLREWKLKRAAAAGSTAPAKPKGVWEHVRSWAEEGEKAIAEGNTKAALAVLQKLKNYALRHHESKKATQ